MSDSHSAILLQIDNTIAPKIIVGARVHTLAKNITHPSECRRRYGSNQFNKTILLRTVIGVDESRVVDDEDGKQRKPLIKLTPLGSSRQILRPALWKTKGQHLSPRMSHTLATALPSLPNTVCSNFCCSCCPPQWRCYLFVPHKVGGEAQAPPDFALRNLSSEVPKCPNPTAIQNMVS